MIFKFQSDSINTPPSLQQSQDTKTFKFQSDSINTDFWMIHTLPSLTLNSNLILLIPVQVINFDSVAVSFKFQSDSINTRVQRHL